ncbi:MAG: hypothetical protein NC131_04240 [Roseburia sp.]|nr:hypothetical protein [Roseburia sp.]
MATTFSALLIVLVIVGTALGALAGFFRKFTKASFWGITVLLALLFERVVGSSVKKSGGGYGIAVILTTVIVLLVLSAVFLTLRELLKKAVEARKKLSEYQNFDERAENEELILNAVDNEDKKEYKKLLRKGKKLKNSAGVWGILDRIFGAVSGGINAICGIATVILFFMLFVDLSGIGALQNAFSVSLASSAWKGLGSDLALDLPLICAISLSIRIGYRGGISSVISTVVVLGLVAGFAAGAWAIASSEACKGAVEGLKNGMLSGLAGTLGGAADVVAKALIAVIIFALSLVVIILVAIFLPKVMEKFRESAVFCAVDGVLGAVLMCVVVIMLFLVFGGVAYTLHEVAFMERFNAFAAKAYLGDGIYSCNPMGSAFNGLPIRSWFKD